MVQCAMAFKIKKGFSTTHIAAIAMVFIFLFGATIITFTHFVYRNSATNSHAARASNIADALVSVIDPVRFAESITQETPDEYRELTRKRMDTIITRIPELKFLYILVPYQDGLFAYYVSAVRLGEPEIVPFLYVERNADLYAIEAVDIAWLEQRTAATDINDTGYWGVVLSAFAPIIDYRGQTIGLVAADIHAAHILADIRNFTITVSVFVLIGSLFLAIIIWICIRALNNATAANKAKSIFLANMSHEMRTPMNAIIGMTSIGMSSDDIKRKDYALTKIHETSQHLLGVINDILDVSKIEADKLELFSTDFNFEKMIQRAVDVVNVDANDKKQNFTVHIDKNIPQVLIGDEQRLTQVITNLLANAIKFTSDEGSISLNAQFMGEENSVCQLKISVSDTGIGITKEQQALLFQAFVQAESGSTRKFKGTGLGLTISKRIIEMMGGKIWIESEIGQGATFIFTIQLKRGKEKSQESLPQSITGTDTDDKENISDRFKGHRILLAEDVDINREIVLTLLEPTLLDIDCAVNGAEAVRIFSEKPSNYELILMDLQMPEMDGYEATRAIRSIDDHHAKNVPIIALSANVFKEDIENCYNAGMNGHVGKPIDFDEILKILNLYLGN